MDPDDCDERDKQAKLCLDSQDVEDGLFWLDIDSDGILTVGAYCNNDFKDE
jgi:hypothetical protein